MDMDVCCAYFCTGLSIFGVLGLLFMYGVLSNGGQWYLGVSDADAGAAADACLVAAGIYLIYLTWCGWKLTKNSPTASKKLSDEDV